VPTTELVEVEMRNTSYFAVITDQHIVEQDLSLYGLNTRASTQALVEQLRQESVPLQGIVSLGDLADTAIEPNRMTAVGTEAAYTHAQELFGELRLPLLPLPGNHDEPSLLEKFFPAAWQHHNHGVHHSNIAGVTLIGIDLRTGPEPTGFASAESIETLDSLLTASDRAVIFSHYPLFDLDNARIDSELSTINRTEVQEVLRRHASKIAACFHGHLHLWITGAQDGILTHGVPSSSFSFVLEPQSADDIRIGEQPCGYLLLGVNDDGSIVVRPRFLPPAQRS
jgi:Icc protein